PPLPAEARRPLPDFPPELRRATPVSDINQAVVYTVNEYTFDDYGLSLARKVGADVLIRGWFKWNRSPDHSKLRAVPAAVHGLGALFGGGITCSALYQGENGLTGEQWDDLATRGPAGQFIDAWDEPGVRHGSLSNPAYRDYLFRWCREQMDAGADYLFMDEPNAALEALEGYDDYANRDFRAWLLSNSPATADWQPTDPRWTTVYRVPLADRAVCPDGTMASFGYRAYLRAMGALGEPRKPLNPLAERWTEFRRWRDQQAWRALTARIRAHARSLGRPVYLSGNGLISDVDLQVLGVWGHWKLRDGQVDLSENQLPTWRATVRRGHQLAGKAVPVVFFHDWGFGTPPFPWMAVSPAERELWMRVRGAEIYAAGARFAFPVLGPFGCDAARDGTLSQIARQTRFYQRHRDFYTGARYLGTDGLASATANLSLAAWWHEEKQALLLHVINRNTRDGALAPQREVAVSLAVPQAPQRAVAVSPDWEGEEPLACTARAGRLELVLPRLEASAVVVLPYGRQPDLGSLHEPVRVVPSAGWARPERAEYVVRADGSIEHGDNLPDFLQGLLHQELRNPPTFVVDVVEGGRLTVNVRAVATLGARLELRIDGQVAHSVDLPDCDGKNDSNAPEYDQTIELALPPGRHRVTLDNVGGDWAKLAWIEFSGRFR
ncbi:MAG: hypothetical protein HUU35_13070, partial [Armatimonadetes bacterium]|nr:hypothetical protein [Armatimonadota bacterium]